MLLHCDSGHLLPALAPGACYTLLGAHHVDRLASLSPLGAACSLCPSCWLAELCRYIRQLLYTLLSLCDVGTLPLGHFLTVTLSFLL